MQKTNLYILSSDTDTAVVAKEILREEKHINIGDNFRNFTDATKFIKNNSKKPSLIFINDHTFNKDDVLDFVNGMNALEEFKKILYTDYR